MRRFTRISQESWISLVFVSLAVISSGCQNRAPSLRMLDARAGYSADLDDAEVALYQRARQHPDSLVQRAAPRIAKVYLYPHELPTRDYFWGGYVSLVVTPDQWIFDKPEDDSETPPAIREVPKKQKRKGKS